jgi:hypothetical protein
VCAAHPRGRRGGEGGSRWAPLVLVVAEVGKERVGGSCSSSWSPRWGRRASMGAARPRGHRGGEGGSRWVPLVVVVAKVGKEGIGGRPSWSWSPRWGRRVSVGAARGHPRRCWGRSCAPPTASASPCRRLPPPPRQAQRPPCRCLPRRLSPRQNQRKERRERTE